MTFLRTLNKNKICDPRGQLLGTDESKLSFLIRRTPYLKQVGTQPIAKELLIID